MRRLRGCAELLMKNSSLIPVERIEKAIYLIHGEKVFLDRDLATLYGVDKSFETSGEAQPRSLPR
jgi:hypothetical protein